MTIKVMKHQNVSLKFMATRKRVFDMSDPGTGKTLVQIMDFAKQHKKDGKAMLVVCPKSLMRAAWANDIKKFAPHLRVSLAYAKNRAEALDADADVFVINVDGVKDLLKHKKVFWKRFGRVVIDECFPAGTLVDTPNGPIPIEVLKIGDLVHTSSGPLPISNTFTHSSDKLVQIEFEDGTKIECTENHPFATTEGWVEAWRTRGLSVVRLDLHQLNQQGPTVLQSELRSQSDVGSKVPGTTTSNCSEICNETLRSPQLEQRGAVSTGNTSETECYAQGVGSSAETSRWQRSHSSVRTNDARDASEILGVSVCDLDRREERVGHGNKLQSGLRPELQEMGSGNRRNFAHLAQTLGCEERYFARLSRVVRVSRLECSSPRMVYNLQVNGPHTYSVAGTLVHNCTAFKHHTSQRSKAMKKLVGHFEWRRAMSGTPTSNGICDLWHQMLLVDDGKRLGTSFFGFRSACCEPKQVGAHAHAIQWVDKEGIEQAVSALISDVVIRHKFEECVDIPANHMYSVPFELTPKHQKIYDELEEESIAILQNTQVSAVHGGALYTKLLQIASGAVYNDDGDYSTVASERYELVLDLVEQRRHSVVFYLWEHQLQELLAETKKRKLPHAVWDPDKPGIADEYQKGLYQVLFAHPASAGHGLTLTKGTATIWASPTPNLEWFSQGKKRVHRIGQSQATETIVVIAENTRDAAVFDSLMRKDVKMTSLLEDLKCSAL